MEICLPNRSEKDVERPAVSPLGGPLRFLPLPVSVAWRFAWRVWH